MKGSIWRGILDGLQGAQRDAVTDGRNAVVAAGAGSGKTRVLSVRYLHLVKERGVPPERILCLTFTKKAAAEMRERIRGMLRDCAGDDADFAAALERFPGSRVSTLDSFCSEIARNASRRWGVAPDFSLDDREAKADARRLALEFLLEVRHEAVPAAFIAAAGFERAVSALAGLAFGRNGAFGATDGWPDPGRADAAILDAALGLHRSLGGLLAPGRELSPGTAAGSRAWVEAAVSYPYGEPEGPAEFEALAGAWERLSLLRKPTGGSEAAAYFNGVADAAKNLASALLLARAALADRRRAGLRAFVDRFLARASAGRASSGTLTFADVAYMARQALLTDLELRAWYKGRFDAIMVDEFQDDNELQKELLYLIAERTDLPGESGRVPLPSELRPGALFFVGDEKQSIYAFRNADVTVFRGLSSELEGSPGGLGAHRLAVNWRSEPALIDFFNETFSRILPAVGDPGARDYEARFEPLEAGLPTPGVESGVAYLEVAGDGDPGEAGDGGSGGEGSDGDESSLDESPDESAETEGLDEAQASRIARLVRDLVDKKVPVAAKGEGGRKEARACRYEDIALLFKSSASQNLVERQFRLLDIPYTAVATAGLFVESVLGDLYAALRLAAHPDDRSAWASYLRGPFARLSDSSVAAVLAEGSGAFAGPGPAGGDAARWIAARETWATLRARADRSPLRELVAYLWHERGLRWNTLRLPGNEAYLEHFDYAWSLAADADRRSLRLADFVSELEGRMGTVDKLEELKAQRESSRGVSIMTVHASKGLEFPVVILPGIENTGRNDTAPPLGLSRRFGLCASMPGAGGRPANEVAALDKALDAMERRGEDKVMDERLAETARLFYVACTRAISRLYLVGKPPRNADAAGKSFRGLLLRAWPWAGPARRADGDFVLRRPEGLAVAFRVEAEPAGGGMDGGERPRQPAREPQAVAAAPASAVNVVSPRMAVTAAAAIAGDAGQGTGAPRPPESPSADAAERARALREASAREGFGEADFGTLCHELTESLLRGGSPEPSERSRVRLGRVSEAARAGITADALAAARGFLASPQGLAARSARDRRAAGVPGAVFELEYAFVWRGEAGSRPLFLNGAMDLVYGDEAAVAVVDFKTDRNPEPERHRLQLSVYREAAEAIFGRPARAFLYYLINGSVAEVSGTPDLAAIAAARDGASARVEFTAESDNG